MWYIDVSPSVPNFALTLSPNIKLLSDLSKRILFVLLVTKVTSSVKVVIPVNLELPRTSNNLSGCVDPIPIRLLVKSNTKLSAPPTSPVES